MSLFPLILLAAQASAQTFTDNFPQQDGLLTNEYAYRVPDSTDSAKSAEWDVPSGSLYVQKGIGWTGVPDGTPANARSTNGTHSAVFRLLTSRGDFGDVSIAFDLLNEGVTASDTTPPVAWDGCHVVARYQNEQRFYYASVNRRDETAVIKKKYGETFYDLTESVPAGVPYNLWQKVRFSVKDNPDGSVWLGLWRDNRLLAQAIDAGTTGGPAYRGQGKIGLRGDNARLRFGHFQAEPLSAPTAVEAAPRVLGLTASSVGADSALLNWTTEAEAMDRLEYGPTASYGQEIPWTGTGARTHALLLTNLSPGTSYHARAWARTRTGLEGRSEDLAFTTQARIDVSPPSVVVVSPASGQTISGPVALVCNAVDDVGVVGVQWQIDGSDVGAEATSLPFTFVWSTQTSNNGPHTLRAIARDAAGHRAVSASVPVIITGAR